MTIKVNLPDGRAINVDAPDAMSAAKAAKAFLEKEAAQKRVVSERGVLQDVDDRVRAVARGVPGVGGGMDEVSAGLNTGFGNLGSYDQELAYQRARDEDFDTRHPYQSGGLQIAGTVLGALAGARQLGGAGFRLPVSLPGRIATGAAGGGALGGIEGYTRGEGGHEKRMESAGESAVPSAMVGAAGPVIGKAIGAGVNKLTKAAAPSIEALKDYAHAAYREAEDAGLRLSQTGFARGIDQIVQGILPTLNATIHPKTYAALKELYGWRGSTPTLRNIDEIRQIAGAAAQTSEKQDARMASKLIESLDDYMAKLGPHDVMARNRKQAIDAITRGRKLWHQTRKAETVQGLFEAAENNARSSTYENALRLEFKKLANNPKKFRSFNDDEKRAILRVVRGTPTEKVLSFIGKAAPKGIVSAGLSPMIGSAAGGLLGGPLGATVGAAALPAVGAAAKQSAAAIAKGNARAVDELVRNGGEAAEGPAAALARYLTESLTIGGSGRVGEEAAPYLPSLSAPISIRR